MTQNAGRNVSGNEHCILNCMASRLDTGEYFNVPIWRTKYVPSQYAFSPPLQTVH
jgi:hypothetical protein